MQELTDITTVNNNIVYYPSTIMIMYRLSVLFALKRLGGNICYCEVD